MEAHSKLKKDWILTPAAFARLLAAFDAFNESKAAQEYEAARARLIKLFRWRNIADAEDAADETLNRVARKLEEGEIVRDISAFISGIARFVILEKFKNRERQNIPLEDAPPDAFVVKPPETGETYDIQRLDCFNRCLRDLPEEMRQTVIEYYNAGEDGSVRITHRKLMAERLGLEINALRNRALRARAKLEGCIQGCVNGKS